jgi:diguanylate cyclase (GGDEF)-like protein
MKESEAHFDHLAHYDALTDLPNRLLFRARVQHAIEQARVSGSRLAVLFLGVDGFEHLNQLLGHAAGDELLRRLAVRLQGLNRDGNTVARLGGDEFGVLLEGVTNPESAGRAGWNMLEGIASTFAGEGHDALLTCSAGISLYPDDGTDFTTLLQNAGVALHRAKGAGSNTYQFYNSEMTERAHERFVIESELRRAVERREFVLHYQPQFSLGTGELTGVEALARWQHPERGVVGPDLFIPIAEESGLIDILGAWTVREACRQAVAWQAEGLPPVRVAVNLSAQQIANSHLVGTVGSALRETGLVAELLELEVTERFLMEKREAAREMLQELKGLGVTLAIDDFGTGYSSLSYLKIYPFDRLKIDQSFLCDVPFRPDDQAIVRAIITLGHGLSLKVVAEGVETEAQAEFLRANLCDEVQGYFYSRPMSAAELRDFLRK